MICCFLGHKEDRYNVLQTHIPGWPKEIQVTYSTVCKRCGLKIERNIKHKLPDIIYTGIYDKISDRTYKICDLENKIFKLEEQLKEKESINEQCSDPK